MQLQFESSVQEVLLLPVFGTSSPVQLTTGCCVSLRTDESAVECRLIRLRFLSAAHVTGIRRILNLTTRALKCCTGIVHVYEY